MKHLAKRTLSLLLAALMVLTIIPAQPLHAHADDNTNVASVVASGVKDPAKQICTNASIKNFSFMGTSYSKSSNGVWPDHVKTLEQMETISGDDNDFSWRTDRGSSSGTIKFSNN